MLINYWTVEVTFRNYILYLHLLPLSKGLSTILAYSSFVLVAIKYKTYFIYFVIYLIGLFMKVTLIFSVFFKTVINK